MTSHQSAYTSGSLRFSPRYIVPALLLGALAACGGGGGGGGGGKKLLVTSIAVDGEVYSNILSNNQRPSNALTMIFAHKAHTAGYRGLQNTGHSVNIAVLDSEFHINHKDLSGQFLKGINLVEMSVHNSYVGAPPITNDQNEVRPVLRRLNDPEYNGDFKKTLEGQINDNKRGGFQINRRISHGTHVAGIIAAKDNGFGVLGVAPEAKIIPVVVSKGGLHPDSKRTIFSRVSKGLDFARKNNAFVYNNSWGQHNHGRIEKTSNGKFFFLQTEDRNVFSSLEIDAWKKVVKNEGDYKGAVVVFAAGNSGWNSETGDVKLYDKEYDTDKEYLEDEKNFKLTRVSDPVIADRMKALKRNLNIPSNNSAFFTYHDELKGSWLAVVAVGADRRIAALSNGCGIAKEYCIAAPGVGVRSTVDSNEYDDGGSSYDKVKDGYHRYSGTSMAAPMVSGALAVLKGKDPQLTAKHKPCGLSWIRQPILVRRGLMMYMAMDC